MALVLVVGGLGLAACQGSSRQPSPPRWTSADAGDSRFTTPDAGRPEVGRADSAIDAHALVDAHASIDVARESGGEAGRPDANANDGAPNTCSRDEDCGDVHLCTGGQCVRCEATCVSDPECQVGFVCVHRNSCTYCGLRDAGIGLSR